MANFNDGLFGSFTAAKKIGTSLERLRYWENLGIVKPNYVQCGTRRFRRYSARDIQRAVLVKMLVDVERYSLAGAMRKLEPEGGSKI
jgi:DNA-binding transcriptional MerR regulator